MRFLSPSAQPLGSYVRLGAAVALQLLLAGLVSAEPAPSPVPAPPASAALRDESHWLADLVVREIVRWRRPGAAAVVTPIDDEGRRYRVVVGTTDVEVAAAEHIWSADGYAPLVPALAAAPPKRPHPASEAASALIKELLTPTTAVLLERDRLLSAQLAAAPEDPGLHEQAALLCAVMAFREAAGRFCDARRELCAATAHLALARSGDRPLEACGRLASALVEALAGREVSALAAQEKLGESADLQAWKRCVRLLAREDWRVDNPGPKASMAEMHAYCRALVSRLNGDRAAAWIEGVNPIAAPDWNRLICESYLSVGSGHRHAKPALEEELPELALLWNHVHGRKMTAGDLKAALTLGDGPGDRRVLGIRRFSAFLARHRAHRLVAAHIFLEDLWGVPEVAKELREVCVQHLAADPLMPLVQMQFTSDPLRLAAAKRVTAMVRQDRGLLTAWLWSYLNQEDALSSAKTDLPDARKWWVGIAPPGTAYQVCTRDEMIGASLPNRKAQIEVAAALAPHSGFLATALAHQRGDDRDPERLLKAYGALADLDLVVAWDLVKTAKTDSARLQGWKRVAELIPDHLTDYAEALLTAGQESEAEAVYERAFREVPDRVRISNCMGWLVDRYVKAGKLARAREIAAHGYEVFSSRGIEIKAKLDEQQGALDDAEKALSELAERYRAEAPLLAFWKRTAEKRPASRTAFQAKVAKLFAKGLIPVRFEDFVKPPEFGVLVTGDSPNSTKHGIRKGCMITALDGYRCDTQEQYVFIRSLSPENQPLDLVVWDGKAYKRIKATGKDRRLNFDMTTFGNRPQATPANVVP